MTWANVRVVPGKTSDSFLEMQMVESVGQKKEFELLWREMVEVRILIQPCR
jgi:hypothetical protein